MIMESLSAVLIFGYVDEILYIVTIKMKALWQHLQVVKFVFQRFPKWNFEFLFNFELFKFFFLNFESLFGVKWLKHFATELLITRINVNYTHSDLSTSQ